MNDVTTSHTDKTLRGLRQIGSAQLFTQLVNWTLTAITVHILEPRDYGLIATAGMFTIFVQMLVDAGLTEVLVSQRELPARLQGAAMTAVFLASSLLAILVFGAAPFVAKFFHAPPLTAILEVSAFYYPLTALGFAPGVILSKRMQFNHLGRIQAAAGTFQGLSTLAFAYAGYGYWALIIGSYLGMSLRVALRWIVWDQKILPNLHLRDLRPIVRNGGHMIGQRVSYFGIDNLDIFLLSRFSGPAALGPYSVARTLAHTALNKISGVTAQVSVPAFAAKAERADQLRGLMTVLSVASAVVFPLFWIMAVVSPVVFPLIFGTRWDNLIIPFSAFASILPLRTLYSLINSSLIGTGRTSLTLRNTLTWLALLVPFMLAGVTKGADGVAIGWAAAFPIVFCIAIRRTSGVFQVGLSVLLKPLLMPLVCTAISASSALFIFFGLRGQLPPLLILLCQCMAAPLLYIVMLRQFSRTQYHQTLSLLHRMTHA